MAASHSDSESSADPLEFSILAHGKTCLTFDELAALRTEPLTGFPAALPPQLLKHSDEQTLASLVAVRRALAAGGLERTDFSQWGVASSSRYLGRSSQAAVLNKYKVDGPWGVSVQAVPHRMPHSVPGTLGLALRNHGPSISVGGGPDDQTDVLLSLAGLLRGGRFPGAWLVVSRWDPELTIDVAGRANSDSRCVAAALAIVQKVTGPSIGSLRFDATNRERAVRLSAASNESAALADFLLADSDGGRHWQCQFDSGLEIAIELKVPSVDRSQDLRPAEVEGQTKYFLDPPAAPHARPADRRSPLSRTRS